MQTVTGYPTDLMSAEPTATVTLNGVVRKVASIQVDRDLPSELPEQVAGSSGITAATGTIVWADDEVSSSRRVHPWGSGVFPPKPWDTVTIDSGYGGVEARILTGVVRGGSGALTSRFVSSAVIDSIHKLNTPVSIEPLLADMPPLASGGNYQYIGITPTYFTDRILRACGFYSTPPQEQGCVFSAPLMGSAWPERGALRTSRAVNVVGSPSWLEVPWGQAAFSLDASYAGAFTPTYTGKLDQNMQVTACIDPGNQFAGSAAGTLTVWWDTDYVRLAFDSNGNVVGRQKVGATVTDIVSMPIQSGRVFTLRVTTGGEWRIRCDDGREVVGGIIALPSTLQSTTALTSVQVFSGHQAKYPMGGVQVCFTSVFSAVNYVQNAYLTPAAHRFSLAASPAIENRNALDLLKEQASAECAAMWLDEYGNFRWVNRDRLTPEGPVVETITAASKIEDLDWEHNTGSVRSKVIINHKVPNISLSKWVNRLAWQGSGQSLEAGEVVEQIISAPSGTDWIVVDETLLLLAAPGSGTLDDFNRGRATYGGGIETDGTVEAWAHIGNTGFGCTMTKLGVNTYKIVTTAGTPTAGRTIELRTIDEGTGSSIWPRWRRQNLPIIRCMATTEWVEQSKTGVNLGPVDAPVLEHDTGWWVHADDVQRLADWLSAQVMAPRPVIRSLSVIPDDRRQLGDIVQVEFDTVSLRCLTVGISNSTAMSDNAVSKDQGLTLRVISAVVGATYGELDAAYSGDTYNQFDTAWSAETYNTLDSDPLRKA